MSLIDQRGVVDELERRRRGLNVASLSWLVSIALHAALPFVVLRHTGGAALMSGTGDDALVVEAGVAIEGVERLGPDLASIDAVEAPPTELSEARPEIKETKTEPIEEPPPELAAAESPRDTEVMQSPEGPEQELLEPKEPEEESAEKRPPQTAAIDQQPELAVEEERGAGPAQTGGATTARSAYYGDVSTRLQSNKVRPRSRLTGTVVVSFVVSSSGKLLSREVIKSSGHAVLDDAALASLDRASPFPPFPQAMRDESIELSVPFRFVTR